MRGSNKILKKQKKGCNICLKCQPKNQKTSHRTVKVNLCGNHADHYSNTSPCSRVKLWDYSCSLARPELNHATDNTCLQMVTRGKHLTSCISLTFGLTTTRFQTNNQHQSRITIKIWFAQTNTHTRRLYVLWQHTTSCVNTKYWLPWARQNQMMLWTL